MQIKRHCDYIITKHLKKNIAKLVLQLPNKNRHLMLQYDTISYLPLSDTYFNSKSKFLNLDNTLFSMFTKILKETDQTLYKNQDIKDKGYFLLKVEPGVNFSNYENGYYSVLIPLDINAQIMLNSKLVKYKQYDSIVYPSAYVYDLNIINKSKNTAYFLFTDFF